MNKMLLEASKVDNDSVKCDLVKILKENLQQAEKKKRLCTHCRPESFDRFNKLSFYHELFSQWAYEDDQDIPAYGNNEKAKQLNQFLFAQQEIELSSTEDLTNHLLVLNQINNKVRYFYIEDDENEEGP